MLEKEDNIVCCGFLIPNFWSLVEHYEDYHYSFSKKDISNDQISGSVNTDSALNQTYSNNCGFFKEFPEISAEACCNEMWLNFQRSQLFPLAKNTLSYIDPSPDILPQSIFDFFPPLYPDQEENMRTDRILPESEFDCMPPAAEKDAAFNIDININTVFPNELANLNTKKDSGLEKFCLDSAVKTSKFFCETCYAPGVEECKCKLQLDKQYDSLYKFDCLSKQEDHFTKAHREPPPPVHTVTSPINSPYQDGLDTGALDSTTSHEHFLT